MTTPSVGNQCVTCKKQNAILTCTGCSQDFCYNHVLEHRQELNKHLDDIELNRDLIQQSLDEQTIETQKHPLIQQIDQWEYESINKIKQIAKETRTQILNYKNKYINRIELKLNNLTDRLRQSRKENDFVETNLNEWNKQLIELKEELSKPSNVTLEYDSTPLVTKIYVGVYGMLINYH
jgi:chromosome segregation ATPase